jgi:hypothetical protein
MHAWPRHAAQAEEDLRVQRPEHRACTLSNQRHNLGGEKPGKS